MSINNNYMAKIAMEKSILKEFSNNSNERITYLNDGNEFQIQLFNPETFTVGAEISINGETMPGVIVIRPGERHWIERPTNSNKKFKFETYEVEDSESVSKAIAKNGVVTVKFYKERVRKPIVNDTPIYITTTHNPNDYIFSTNDTVYFEGTASTHPRYKTVLTNSTCNNSCSRSFASSAVSNSNDNARCAKGISNDNAYFGFSANISNDNIKLCSATIENNICNDTVLSMAETPEIATMETGRITAGSHSDQTFNTVNIDFEYWSYKTETIKILPMSRKPFTSSDLQKVYCSSCGRKLNPKYKFCPYCGNKCD